MNGYNCWFCRNDIELDDPGAVMIVVESLWRWDAGSRSDDDPWQQIYAHSMCAKERVRGATMKLEPSVFGEDDEVPA